MQASHRRVMNITNKNNVQLPRRLNIELGVWSRRKGEWKMKSIVQEMVELLEKVKDVEQAATMLVERAYDKGFDNGVIHAKLGLVAEQGLMTAGETLQQKRDRIVEQAKEFVEKVTNEIYEDHNWTNYVDTGHTRTEFVINKDKRTVVALLFNRYYGDCVEYKGIAKCAPEDCFNEHIGKAIALHRALGLDVPQEYLVVPNPTEVRVSNVVDVTDSQDGSFIKKEKVVEIRKRFDKYYPHFKGGYFATHYKITDDTESEPNV